MKDKNETRINNFAVIQYELENGDMKILVFSDYDIWKLKHRVSLHIPKKILSIQFYYNVSTNDEIKLVREGVVIK